MWKASEEPALTQITLFRIIVYQSSLSHVFPHSWDYKGPVSLRSGVFNGLRVYFSVEKSFMFMVFYRHPEFILFFLYHSSPLVS